MIKKFLLIYLLIGFIGYTFFNSKDATIIDIVSIDGEVNEDIKEALTTDIIKANVLIHAYTYDNLIGIKYHEIKQIGSGVIIDVSEDYYYVLTNAHIVSFKYELGKFIFQVFDYQGNSYQASLIKISLEDDLALLKFKKVKPLKVINVSDKVLVYNEEIIAIGNPYDIINCITTGKFNSFVNISFANYEVINHSAKIDSGNSGGMLLNFDYELVGINTWAYFDREGNYQSSLAIPSKIIIEFLN